VSPLAIKLVAFGELALIQSINRRTQAGVDKGQAGVDKGMGRLDYDGDAVAVAIDKPVKWHDMA
jgi:hypothetical protein